MEIVVVGSLNMDLVVKLPQIPKPGETLLGGVFNTFPGGKGANQAVASARLGASVTMVGCVGKDAFGKELCDGLAHEGINISHIRMHDELATGVALIEVDAHGQNSIAVASGANFGLTSSDVSRALKAIGEFNVLVMPLEIPLDVVFTAAKIAATMNATVILNPAPAQRLDKSLLELVDLLIPNEHEIAAMTGTEVTDGSEIMKNCQSLFSAGVKNVLVTMGGRGSVLVESDGTQNHILPYHTEVVDTTAAGDCFVGAMAVALNEKRTYFEAANFASAAASISVSREGAQPSLPFRKEVEQIINTRC